MDKNQLQFIFTPTGVLAECPKDSASELDVQWKEQFDTNCYEAI